MTSVMGVVGGGWEEDETDFIQYPLGRHGRGGLGARGWRMGKEDAREGCDSQPADSKAAAPRVQEEEKERGTYEEEEKRRHVMAECQVVGDGG